MRFNILILAIFLFQTVSQAGGVSGGDGGHGVVCTRVARLNVPQTTIEVLDLYEARRKFQGHWLKAWPYTSNFSDDEDFRYSVYQVMKHKSDVVEKLLGREHPILKSFSRAMRLKFRYAFKEMALTRDTGALQVPLPRRCEIVQIAVREVSGDEEIIHINWEYAEGLSKYDIAAVLLHEALHSYFHSDSTIAIRQFVGYVFADKSFRLRNRELFHELVEEKKPIELGRFR